MSKKESKPEKAGKVIVPAEMLACLDDKGENYLVKIDLLGVDEKA